MDGELFLLSKSDYVPKRRSLLHNEAPEQPDEVEPQGGRRVHEERKHGADQASQRPAIQLYLRIVVRWLRGPRPVGRVRSVRVLRVPQGCGLGALRPGDFQDVAGRDRALRSAEDEVVEESPSLQIDVLRNLTPVRRREGSREAGGIG